MTRGPFRSLLFAPGNHPRKAEKVFGAGADAAISPMAPDSGVAMTRVPQANASNAALGMPSQRDGMRKASAAA